MGEHMEHMPFGAFNPRLYGVSQFLSDDERWDAHRRYNQIDNPGEWAKHADDQSATDIYTLSALDHEVRHFHDFLLSPIGIITMGLRMQASINGVQAMDAIRRSSGRFVPAPLNRWICWDIATREDWIASTGSHFGIESMDDVVAIPHDLSESRIEVGAREIGSLSDRDQVSVLTLGAARAYASMNTLRKHRVSQLGLDVSADDVFEGAAHLVQLQAVWSGQGEVPAQRFINFILESPAKHLKPLQLLWTEMQHRNATVQRMTELFTWMLLGPIETLMTDGHPASRYFSVLAIRSNEDVFTSEIPTAQLFDQLDALTNSRPWRENLTSASAAAERRMASYSELSNRLNGEYFDALFNVCAIWNDDQSAVKMTFLSDPESLAHPGRYLNEPRYPLPFVETRFGWGIHERESPLNLSHHRAISVDSDGKRALGYISALDPDRGLEAVDSVRTARLVTHITDLLFADETSIDLYEQWCRSHIEKVVGKAVVSVY